eukprot:4779943-Pyramimonas_sp.AAC.1
MHLVLGLPVPVLACRAAILHRATPSALPKLTLPALDVLALKVCARLQPRRSIPPSRLALRLNSKLFKLFTKISLPHKAFDHIDHLRMPRFASQGDRCLMFACLGVTLGASLLVGIRSSL